MTGVMRLLVVAIALGAHILIDATDIFPVVTLSHGGQLRGKYVEFNNTKLEVFTGVRYAKPPVGTRRFKKPEAAEPWQGIRNATVVGNACPQQDSTSGKEDCLFLDITLPPLTRHTDRKAVMVWIHGGYLMGGVGSSNIAAPLSSVGDVIVIVLNYRLGALGFLTDGPGSGNFGLWDQREAIVWVKNNIASFGGNPESITIFGQSSGGTSVAAQVIGQHNTGLFQRAIVQSGSLFNSWAWYSTHSSRQEISRKIKVQMHCDETLSVYKCLENAGAAEVMNVLDRGSFDMFWIPVPDNDFFADNATDDSYALSQRYDLMGGFGNQEGLFCISDYFKSWSDMVGMSYMNGISMEWVNGFLPYICEKIFTPLSPQLCSSYLIAEYGLESLDDRQRLIKLSNMCGEESYDADIYRILRDHASTSSFKTTYGYYFTEAIDWGQDEDKPDWSKVGADHSDDLHYMFGYPYITEELYKDYIGEEMMNDYFQSESYGFDLLGEDGKPLSDITMKMWSNFAKTGNPNLPQSIGPDTPKWPEFDLTARSFMDINDKKRKIIPVPNGDRLDRLLTNIFETRRIQSLALDQIGRDDPKSQGHMVTRSQETPCDHQISDERRTVKDSGVTIPVPSIAFFSMVLIALLSELN